MTAKGDKWGRTGLEPKKPERIEYNGPNPVKYADNTPEEFFDEMRIKKKEDDEFQKECKLNYKKLVAKRLAQHKREMEERKLIAPKAKGKSTLYENTSYLK